MLNFIHVYANEVIFLYVALIVVSLPWLMWEFWNAEREEENPAGGILPRAGRWQ